MADSKDSGAPTPRDSTAEKEGTDGAHTFRKLMRVGSIAVASIVIIGWLVVTLLSFDTTPQTQHVATGGNTAQEPTPIKVTEDMVSTGPHCDGVQITVALHPAPQPVRAGCIMAWGINQGSSVTLIGPNGEKKTVLSGEQKQSNFAVAQWQAEEGTLVDVAYCPMRTHWSVDHCEPDSVIASN
jgi:hypothetical protein